MHACARGQVHIKHVGTAGMLFNPVRLRGIAPKIHKLVQRELNISAEHDDDALARGLPMQMAELAGRARSGDPSDSAAPSPLRSMVSTPADALTAPRVERVPGVPDAAVRFWLTALLTAAPFCALVPARFRSSFFAASVTAPFLHAGALLWKESCCPSDALHFRSQSSQRAAP
jgi:hypothetical protein